MHQLTAQQLASIHAVGDHDVNPATGEIAFTWNASGEPSLYLLPPGGGSPRRLIEGNGQFGSWSPDGRLLVYLQDVGGAEADDVMLLDMSTGEPRAVTDDPYAYTWPRLAPDGRLALISNREGTFDPYLLDLGSGKFHRLAEGERAASSLAWSPDGRYLGFLRLAPPAEGGALVSGLFLYDTLDDSLRPLGALEGDLFHADWSWRPGTPPRLCVPAESGEYEGLLLITPDNEWEPLELGDGDKMQPRWSPDGQRLAYIHSALGDRMLRLWDTTTGEQRDLSVGDGVHRQPRWAPDGQSLTVIFENSTNPPDLWRVSLDGTPQQLTRSLPADFPGEALTPATHVTLDTFDEWKVPALLYAPTEANGAAVLWIHGGPAGQHPNGWFPDIQLLTNLGYTVLAPNMRGSSGFGRSYRELSRFDWGGGELRDLAAANHYLRQAGFHRVGIMGGSLGGYLTLLAIAKQPELWDAAAALYPIASLLSLYESTRPGDLRSYLEDHIGTPQSHPDLFYDRSPIHFVENIRAPLLMLQGANDPRTPLSEAESMAERLAAEGKEYYLHVYPNEGHGFRHRENREDAMNRVLAFFNEHLYLR